MWVASATSPRAASSAATSPPAVAVEVTSGDRLRDFLDGHDESLEVGRPYGDARRRSVTGNGKSLLGAEREERHSAVGRRGRGPEIEAVGRTVVLAGADHVGRPGQLSH